MIKKSINIARLGHVTLLDFLKLSNPAYDNSFHIEKAIEWLCTAQDSSNDGGVSEGFHLYHGWLPSYPETTGYIIETFFEYYKTIQDLEIKKRAIRMADWLLSIQEHDGAITDSYFRKKMVFDTGQIIFGLIRTYEETREERYYDAAVKAGEWLVKTQDEDGAWRKYAVDNIPHTYYTRVAWSLIKLFGITKEKKFLDACTRSIDWAISRQEENGWFNKASFNLKNHGRPFTHTIAYTIRGILETGLYLNEDKYIRSATTSINNLMHDISQDGKVSGTYDINWKGKSSFGCLTGNAQLAIIFLKLYVKTKDEKYLNAGKQINNYLKKRQVLRIKDINVYGAIAGSYPVWGKYIHFTYPNWAAKFFIDALILEAHLSV